MPLIPKVAGFKYAIRIMDLSAADCVEFTCVACSHSHRVAPYQLRLRFMEAMRIEETAKQFRCRSCGARASGSCPARWAVYTATLYVVEVSSKQR